MNDVKLCPWCRHDEELHDENNECHEKNGCDCPYYVDHTTIHIAHDERNRFITMHKKYRPDCNSTEWLSDLLSTYENEYGYAD